MPSMAGPVQLVIVQKDDGQKALITLDRVFGAALSFLCAAASRGAAFGRSDLPGLDAFEQTALCYRLVCLGVVRMGPPPPTEP